MMSQPRSLPRTQQEVAYTPRPISWIPCILPDHYPFFICIFPKLPTAGNSQGLVLLVLAPLRQEE
jgi:hypothetical protein